MRYLVINVVQPQPDPPKSIHRKCLEMEISVNLDGDWMKILCVTFKVGQSHF